MKRVALTALAVVLAVAGCGRDGTATAQAAVPSSAARLACSADALGDITTGLGVGVTKPLAPRWAEHTYTCSYVFADGTMVLSVTDNADATTALAALAAHRPTNAVTVPGLGQQAYAVPDGTTVVRKDASILTVDVTGLPATFGVPPHPRNIDAITVAETILSCWTEDS
ncbi:MAG TPA: hypothetical protein VGF84_08405 [Micromonosporaceae bacterium]